MRRTAEFNLERRSRSARISTSISLDLFIFRTSICIEGSTRGSRRASSDKTIPILQRPGPNDTE